MEPKILWEPDSEFIRESNLFMYVEWLKENKNVDLEISENARDNVKN